MLEMHTHFCMVINCYVKSPYPFLIFDNFRIKQKFTSSLCRLLSNNVMALMNMKGRRGKREFGTSPIYGVVNGKIFCLDYETILYPGVISKTLNKGGSTS